MSHIKNPITFNMLWITCKQRKPIAKVYIHFYRKPLTRTCTSLFQKTKKLYHKQLKVHSKLTNINCRAQLSKYITHYQPRQNQNLLFLFIIWLIVKILATKSSPRSMLTNCEIQFHGHFTFHASLPLLPPPTKIGHIR